MQSFPPTIIIRHKKENLKKCSLRGLESRDDIIFYTYPHDLPSATEGYLQLTVGAPPLTAEDRCWGLLILDGTWRYAAKMAEVLGTQLPPIHRSLPPHYRTAYPRRQEDCPDPEAGLASIEALFLAYHLMGRETQGLLDHYHWKEKFLEQLSLSN